jgi:hypothetical protein
MPQKATHQTTSLLTLAAITIGLALAADAQAQADGSAPPTTPLQTKKAPSKKPLKRAYLCAKTQSNISVLKKKAGRAYWVGKTKVGKVDANIFCGSEGGKLGCIIRSANVAAKVLGHSKAIVAHKGKPLVLFKVPALDAKKTKTILHTRLALEIPGADGFQGVLSRADTQKLPPVKLPKSANGKKPPKTATWSPTSNWYPSSTWQPARNWYPSSTWYPTRDWYPSSLW